MMPLIGAGLVATLVVVYILHPLVTGRKVSLDRTVDEPSEAQNRKRIALMGLRDVEYDWAMGKLDEDDYHRMRDELSLEALEALEAQRRVEEGEEEPSAGDASPTEGESGEVDRGKAYRELQALEAEIARIRREIRNEVHCPSCGAPNEGGSRFCADCGQPLEAEAASRRGTG